MKEHFKVWYIGSKAYIDIDDAVEAVVTLVGDRERASCKSVHDDAHVMIFKEARADLQHMDEGDTRDFMGVLVTVGNISLDLGNYSELGES